MPPTYFARTLLDEIERMGDALGRPTAIAFHVGYVHGDEGFGISCVHRFGKVEFGVHSEVQETVVNKVLAALGEQQAVLLLALDLHDGDDVVMIELETVLVIMVEV